ncbi:phosphatidylinositol N-acetylglucosaminyltransferase [Saccharomycopsis crataegensis]|uniref:Phosphatidylinositol N-acetylglucosaminyltransferase n=1 Tax=Saccharomycopsis crataegensis TaxID=43959 RepID=A0AAV5QV51_9ASCO|nr:phosphatidylinositol N-acetylglucosaminyltransferase [Saccharomycopsis crataegensis]
MQTHCYYPKDLLNEYLFNTPCLIIGLQLNPEAQDYIIVTLIPFNPAKLDSLFHEKILQVKNGRIVFGWNGHGANNSSDQLHITERDKVTNEKSFNRRKRGRRKAAGRSRNHRNYQHESDQGELENKSSDSIGNYDYRNDLKYFVLGFLNHQTSNRECFGLPLNFVYNNMTQYPISTNIQLDLKVILFDVPDPRVMQFYSIKPIDLGLENVPGDDVNHDKRLDFAWKIKYHGNIGNMSPQEKSFEQIIRVLNECYFHRLFFYNETGNESVYDNAQMTNSGLKIIKPWEQNFSIARNLQNLRIFLVNHLYILPTYGNHTKKRKKKSRQRSKSISKYSEGNNASPYSYYEESSDNGDDSFIERNFKMLVIHSVVWIRMIIQIFFWILNIKPFGKKTIKESSLMAQQIDLRLQQICSIPSQFIKIKQQHNFTDYIRLYNTIWLILNDVIFGFTVGQYVYERSLVIQEFLVQVILRKFLFEEFYKLTFWLMNFPAGFKLNSKLAVFFGELFLWIIDFFYGKIVLSDFFTNYLITGCIFLISYGGGVFGATFILSIACDFFNFVTLHIYCFYFASAKIFNWLLVILKSLFNLFYGKKNNVLKKRIDSADYSLDQLLLGTLLFTITLFIVPTVLAFYLSFTIVRLIVLIFVICLEVILSCLNHFPIFAVLLRIKDQFRVPGGINFKLLNFINDESLDYVDSGDLNGKISSYYSSEEEKSDDDDDDDDGDYEYDEEEEEEEGDYEYDEEEVGYNDSFNDDVNDDDDNDNDNDNDDNDAYEDDDDYNYNAEEDEKVRLGMRGETPHMDGTFNDKGNIIYLELQSEPLSFKNIFHPYISLWDKLKLYYFSSSTLKSLLMGIPITVSRNKLYHSLYLMLPMKPIEASTLFGELKKNYIS